MLPPCPFVPSSRMQAAVLALAAGRPAGLGGRHWPPPGRLGRHLVVPSLKAPAGLPATIEPLAGYVGQDSCRPGYLAGTAALGRLLTATYRNTTSAAPRLRTDAPRASTTTAGRSTG